MESLLGVRGNACALRHTSRSQRTFPREFWLNERQWKRLQPLLPHKSRGIPRVDDRRVISGIVHVMKSGGRWVNAPTIYGPRKTLYNRFIRWGAAGIWQKLFQELTAAGGPPAKLLLDSTHVKAHRCAAGGKGGQNQKAVEQMAALQDELARERAARVETEAALNKPRPPQGACRRGSGTRNAAGEVVGEEVGRST